MSHVPHPAYSTPSIDGGESVYLITIYNYMAGSLALSGIMAYLSAQSDVFLQAMYTVQAGAIIAMKPVAWVILLTPLVLLVVLMLGLKNMSLSATQFGYWLYSAIMGLSLSVLFLRFSGESMARALFISAAAFISISLYGSTTKRDLAAARSFLIMGFGGLMMAMAVNLFFKSSVAQFATSLFGVLLFTGLCAFDSQKLRAFYNQFAEDKAWRGKLAILGALTLYLDFITIFANFFDLFRARKR